MSDSPTPSDPTSDNSTAQPVTNADEQKQPRSPVERVVVWGGISILLIIAGIQGMAAYGFTVSKDKIVAAFDKVEESSSGEVSLSEAEAMMAGFWNKSEIQKKNSDHFVVYSWSGVYQSYSVLLTVGSGEGDPLVIGYELNSETSNHAETIEAIQTQRGSETADRSDDSTAGPTTPAGAMGSGGGRPSIDWDELDKDGDGKVSKEEAPERMLQFFDRIDTNGDGFIDDGEREEMRRRREERQNNGGQGRGSAEGGGRPQRPTNDDDPPAKSSPNDEPVPPAKPQEASSSEAQEE